MVLCIAFTKKICRCQRDLLRAVFRKPADMSLRCKSRGAPWVRGDPRLRSSTTGRIFIVQIDLHASWRCSARVPWRARASRCRPTCARRTSGFTNAPGPHSVTLGFAVPLSGPYADEGADELRALELAVEAPQNGEGRRRDAADLLRRRCSTAPASSDAASEYVQRRRPDEIGRRPRHRPVDDRGRTAPS